MAKIIGLVLWVGGIAGFYFAFLDDVLGRFSLDLTSTSRIAGTLLFAGIWALVVNFLLALIPTHVRAKMG